MAWWHDSYIYRRVVTLLAPRDVVPKAHPITVRLSETLQENGKVRADYEDIEVVFLNDEDEFELLYRDVEPHPDGGLLVTFQLQEGMQPLESISGTYCVYYGNLDLIDRPERPDSFIIDGGIPSSEYQKQLDGGYPHDDEVEIIDGGGVIGFTSPEWARWPVGVHHSDTLVTYTRPGEHWQQGESTYRHARASMRLYASRFRVISSVGYNKGIMEVRVDDGEWQEVDLFYEIWPNEEGILPEVPVFEMELEGNEIHEVVFRVSGNSNISSVGSTINIRRVEYTKPVMANDSGEEIYDMVWSSSVGGG